MAKIKNQFGFTALEGLLIAFIIVVIGGVGWFVWHSRQNNSTKQSTGSTGTQTLVKPPVGTITTGSMKGYKKYEDSRLSLEFPEDWTKYNDDTKPDWIYFKSTDYEPAAAAGQNIKAGTWLEVSITKSASNDSYDNDWENVLVAEGKYGGTHQTVTIDGTQAILTDSRPSGAYWLAKAYKHNNTYMFRYNVVDEDVGGVEDAFKVILTSVHLK